MLGMKQSRETRGGKLMENHRVDSDDFEAQPITARLFDRQPREMTQLHNPRLPRIQTLQPLQSLIQCK